MSETTKNSKFELPFGLGGLLPHNNTAPGGEAGDSQSLAEQLMSVEVTDLLTKSFWTKWLNKFGETVRKIKQVLPADIFGTDGPITLGTIQQTFERAADAYESIQSGEYAPVVAGILGVSLGLDQDSLTEKKEEADDGQVKKSENDV